MVLAQEEGENGASRIVDRRFGREDGGAGLIAPSWTRVDSPCGLILAVDGELDRTGNPALFGLVIEYRLPKVFPED